MLRRNFMSILGLGGIGSLFHKDSPPVDLEKVYRFEDEFRVQYLKYIEVKPEEINKFTIINGELSNKYDLVFHNPNGPAHIYKNKRENSTTYKWYLNGKITDDLLKPTVITVHHNSSFFLGTFRDTTSTKAKYIHFYSKDGGARVQEWENLERTNDWHGIKTKEWFESQIGMTIEKLLSFN